jgi:hypothetical protein
MKLLVATKETQGERKNDFCWCNEGEIVKFGIECDGETVDGSCGCKRALCGVDTSKATTTMKVVKSNVSPTGLNKIIKDSLAREGWLANTTDSEAYIWAGNLAGELIRIAELFQVNDIIEKRGKKFQLRLRPRPSIVSETEFLRDIRR